MTCSGAAGIAYELRRVADACALSVGQRAKHCNARSDWKCIEILRPSVLANDRLDLMNPLRSITWTSRNSKKEGLPA